MTERVIDPARSRIVLVGPAYYEDPQLENVPAIVNNISDLAQVLTNEKLGGFNPFHCIAVPSAAGVAQVGDVLVRAAEEAEDLLLFYYSGHGLLGPRRRELYLSLAATRHDQLAFTAVPFEAVRDACLQSRATSRVVILDSCYSGRAIGDTLAGNDEVDEAVLGEIEVSGAYTLTSSPANRAALVLPGERHTAFTERLLAMLSAGSPAAGTMISLGDIYRHLHTRLRAEGLPLPQRCGVNNADLLGLVRNVQSGRAPGDAPAAADAEPQRVASTDMTQRLTHAERIANTIGDGLWRTRALARVALAANAFDPGRVGRLIDQAEQAAGTITHEDYRWQALRAVAKAVAAANPDRAERIANTITNKYTREGALAAVAKAVAASHPDRAEHIASTITDKSLSEGVLAAVAMAVAADDPDRAEHIANTITDKPHRLNALSAVAKAVAASHPDRAEHIANEMARPYNRWFAFLSVETTTLATALSAVARVVAADDPDRAERIARATSNKSLSEGALAAVAMAVAADDPDRAEHIASTITDKSLREGVLAAVAKAVAASHPDRAEHIANTITDKYTQVTVLIAVASAAADGDPEHAASLIGQAEQTASMVKLHARTEALTAVATAAAAFDPDRAERIAHATSDKSTKASVLIAVAAAVAADDPDRAERIANTITDEYSRGKALASIARAVAVVDPDRARRIAHRVPSQAKAEILHSVVLVLAPRQR
ncbi:caspase domain-containing protein [Streptomyces sp. NPDC056638]|uniref:caspase family protein n=1 Tax=Streptomyces sp. NPDC056638 TaxID=3345887 RepID=UPI003690786C